MSVATSGDETVAKGMDELAALFGAGSALLFGGGALLFFEDAQPWYLALLASLTILSTACRYELRFSAEGIQLTLYRFWLVPVYRRRFLLDAEIELYQAFEADAPDGLCIRPPPHLVGREKETEAFGPYFQKERLLELHRELLDVLDRLRAAAPPPPPALRNALLEPWRDALDLARAVRDGRGRLREVTSTAAIEIGAILLPPGSVFYLNDGMFIDPRRDDELREVALSDTCVVRELCARPGGRLVFDSKGHLGSIRAGLDSEVLIEDLWVDGRDVVAFEASGHLTGFTLARPTQFAHLRIPSKTRFVRWPGGGILPARWTCWLGGDLELPEIKLRRGESIELSLNRDCLRAISPHRDVRLGEVVIRHGIVAIPVHHNGRIDVDRCKRMGIVGRADERVKQA